MKHIHFKEIESTQQYLKQELSSLIKGNTQILISTDRQTHGIGRKDNHWVDSDGSIAFSCLMPSTEKLSLVPLWLSLTLKDFFKRNFDTEIQLKWPNDLYFKEKKCGGVICHKVDDFIIVGIGINLIGKPQKIYDNLNQVGHLEIDINILPKNFKEEIPLQIYHHITNSPFIAEEIPEHFKDQCLFMGKMVKISDETDVTQGKFVGIGEWGEALVKDESSDNVNKIYNGSMRIKNN